VIERPPLLIHDMFMRTETSRPYKKHPRMMHKLGSRWYNF
jgi:hypothetical protein